MLLAYILDPSNSMKMPVSGKLVSYLE